MKYLFYAIILLLIISSCSITAQTYYVDYANGNDTYSGTISQPFKLISKALSTLGSNSGTIYLRDGTHLSSLKFSLNKNGASGDMIKIWAYSGENPIIDFTGIATNTDGFSISGTYYHLKGLEIIKAGHNGINISGNNNTIENCRVHACSNTGIHITGSSTGSTFPSNNLILNCDSYFNFDSPDGGDADGFSAKWNVGSGNVFRGCRAYNNSDDGWDLWMCTGSITIENCYAYRNGVDSWHTGLSGNNGNGFKLGGSNVATPHIVKNCLSFDNAGGTGRGFDENNNLAGQTLYNCTSFRNLKSNYYFNNDPLSSGTHSIVNCISYLGGLADVFKNTVAQTNSWQGFTVSDADFIDSTGIDTAGISGPRNTDGSLPSTNFMHLKNGSDLVDAGTDVGIAYKETAPDLGYFESPFSAVPVELVAFTATTKKETVFLNWRTATEVNNYGFEVERSQTSNVKSETWEKIGFVSGNGNSNSPKEYSFVDKSAKQSGYYFYRLKQIDADGMFEHSTEVAVKIETPITLSLSQNYPNPFNPTTRINYQLPLDSKVTLELYSIFGERITTIINDELSAGYYTVDVNASALNLASGVYIYKMTAQNSTGKSFLQAKKLMLTK